MEGVRKFIFSVMVLSAAWLSPCAVAEPHWQFGVVPQQAPGELASKWVPFLEYVSRKSGHSFRFATAKSIHVYDERFFAGSYDFSYVNPHLYALKGKPHGYSALARERDGALQGIVVVAKDSPYKTLSDLSGQPLAFPGKVSFAATLLPLAHLAQQGVKVMPNYVSPHDSVYHNVAKGLYAAGGGVMKTLNGMDARTRAQLRILWTTPLYTTHPIAVHERVPKEVRELVLEVLLAMHDDPEGAAILGRLGFKKGIMAAQDTDYEELRRLKISDAGAAPSPMRIAQRQ